MIAEAVDALMFLFVVCCFVQRRAGELERIREDIAGAHSTAVACRQRAQSALSLSDAAVTAILPSGECLK